MGVGEAPWGLRVLGTLKGAGSSLDTEPCRFCAVRERSAALAELLAGRGEKLPGALGVGLEGCMGSDGVFDVKAKESLYHILARVAFSALQLASRGLLEDSYCKAGIVLPRFDFIRVNAVILVVELTLGRVLRLKRKNCIASDMLRCIEHPDFSWATDQIRIPGCWVIVLTSKVGALAAATKNHLLFGAATAMYTYT